MAFLIETYIAPSKIEGIGVFAQREISNGEIIWRFDPMIDRTYEPDQVAKFNRVTRDFVARYSYFNARLKLYVLCGDHARFVNHSYHPNIVERVLGVDPHGLDLANTDIAAGDELTIDYYTYDAEASAKLA